MREGQFEVELVGDDERLFAEEQIDGTRYVVAEPGKQYSVRINIYRDEQGNFPAKYIRIGLYVDGYDVQYWKRVDLSDPSQLPNDGKPVFSRFWGFKSNTSEIKSFVFMEPQSSDIPQSSQQMPLGSFKVVVYEATVTEGVFSNNIGAQDAPGKQTTYEGKKFWQQASVATSAGKTIQSDKETFQPLVRWANKSSVPLQVLEMQYHTPSFLQFLRNFRSQPLAATENNKRSIDSIDSYRGGEKRSRMDNVVVDLTDNEIQQASTENNDNSSSNSSSQVITEPENEHEKEIVVDHDVSILPAAAKRRIIPMMDLSEDNPVESTVTVVKDGKT